MTKREKILGVSFLILIAIIAHVFIAFYIKNYHLKQQEELNGLNQLIKRIETNTISAEVRKELNWLNRHTPSATDFKKSQTSLQNFLQSSSKRLGFSSFTKDLLKPDSDGLIYQKVGIQMSARATEKQIYQWLVEIHQPQKMRILSYLKISPPVNDSNLISCEIIAIQYIVPIFSE